MSSGLGRPHGWTDPAPTDVFAKILITNGTGSGELAAMMLGRANVGKPAILVVEDEFIIRMLLAPARAVLEGRVWHQP